jgi:hypothetical protein
MAGMEYDKSMTTNKIGTIHLFFQGAETIGQIFPPARQSEPANWTSAWQGVGDAFAAAGDNLRDAIDEVHKAQGDVHGA